MDKSFSVEKETQEAIYEIWVIFCLFFILFHFKNIYLGKMTTWVKLSNIRRLTWSVRISESRNRQTTARETYGKGCWQFPKWWDPKILPPASKLLTAGSLGKCCVLLEQIMALDGMMGNSDWNVQLQCKGCPEWAVLCPLWTYRPLSQQVPS